MKKLTSVLIFAAVIITGFAVSVFFSEDAVNNLADSGDILAFALLMSGNIPGGIFASVRKWHGSIDDQFSNIDNLVNKLTEHQKEWIVPPTLLDLLTTNRNALQTLINHCRTTAGSTDDRAARNTLLKSTVGLCLLQVQNWVVQAYIAGALTADDVHSLGFLLPGERGGKHERSKETDVIAEVKVTIINEDFIRVVIDQSSGENAGPVLHGWPHGVKNALIVITSSDGKDEIYRGMTNNLHNDIKMPVGSHGKQFIIKAAFLKHVADEPKFGNQPTFSMPLTTEDLVRAIDRQHHEEFEEHILEVERQRQEIERLQKELRTKN
ncbi:MAG: hypothetical protein LBS54_03715 [Dysgonamonadaceae bacterium]|jgi:hypothetical protein|nr:hypothetical protein [Dysgonamonadaceae bacterium]